MSDKKWLLIASTDVQTFVAQTNNDNMQLIYRALTKWLIRGAASKILDPFWEYIDQYDNELEDALLDQLVTQAETNPEDPQITNVRSKDYSIDMSVLAKNSNQTFKTCKVEFTLFVYFQSLKQKLRMYDQAIDLTMVRMENIETIAVNTATKTPAHEGKEIRRVKKRSSKVTK